MLNKADLLGGVANLPVRGDAAPGRAGAVAVSAITGEGLRALEAAIDARIAAGMEVADYAIAHADGARLAWLYQHGEVIDPRRTPTTRCTSACACCRPTARGSSACSECRTPGLTMTFGLRDLTDLAALLRAAARAEVMPRFRNLMPNAVRTKTDALDPVTEADTAAEAAITAGLLHRFPGAVVVGEEATAADPSLLGRLGDADLAFVVDPVDGTANFADGLPLFAVMAAALIRGEVVAAAIHDPLGDDWALALRGEGAWRECTRFPEGVGLSKFIPK